MKFDTTKHILVPKHTKLNEAEKKALFQKHRITVRELPKISLKDPAIAKLKLKSGDVVKIMRKSLSAGEAAFYRGVIDA